MGRKIPGKKHHGVKDPHKQRAKREAELVTKINAPPKDPNDQAIPRSLENLVKLTEAIKSGKLSKLKKKKKKKKDGLICVGGQNPAPLHPKARPEKVVPIFKQRPGETANHFLYRVGKDTHAFLNETAFEKKYDVEVNRNPCTGKVEGVTKRQKDELDELEMLRAKHKNIKKKRKKEGEAPPMTKAQKRKEKLKLKKEKKEETEVHDFESLRDQVEFGEVAHAPPQLKARPRKADSSSSAKPGKKDLLLNSLLKKNEPTKTVNKLQSIDRSGKRKNLPVGERRQLEKQQSDIIAEYRRLKAQRFAEADS